MTEEVERGSAHNSSARHVFEALRLIRASEEPLGVSEVSRAIGLSLSTAQRALATLEHAGYLTRQPHSTKYELGFAADRLVHGLFARYRIRGTSVPYLRHLATLSQRTISLCLRLGWYGVRTAVIEAGHHSLSHARRLGEVNLLHEEIPSRTILAFLDQEQRAEYWRFAKAKLVERSDRTSAADIDSVLLSIRERGYDLGDGRDNPFETLAVPIRNNAGTAIAAVALEAPWGEAQPLETTSLFEDCLAVIRKLERVVQSRPEAFCDPFAQLNPSEIEIKTTR